MSGYLSDDEFQALFDNFKRSAFNANLLPEYDVSVDKDSFERWRRGEPISDHETNSWWQGKVREYVRQGKQIRRLKVINGSLTEYQRNGLEWWWPYNDAAGETTRVLDLAEVTIDLPPQDFWELDDEIVIVMDYDDNGKWLGARRYTEDISPFLQWRDAMWELSKPWQELTTTNA